MSLLGAEYVTLGAKYVTLRAELTEVMAAVTNVGLLPGRKMDKGHTQGGHSPRILQDSGFAP